LQWLNGHGITNKNKVPDKFPENKTFKLIEENQSIHQSDPDQNQIQKL
jgi:hypothetical protein